MSATYTTPTRNPQPYPQMELTQNYCTCRLSCTSRTITRHSHAAFEFIQFNSSDVIISTMASQITSLTISNSIVYSCADQRKHQSSASLAFVRRIHQWPVNSPQKGPVTRKKFLFEDFIMFYSKSHCFEKIGDLWILKMDIKCCIDLHILNNVLALPPNQRWYRCLERIRYSKEMFNHNSLYNVVFDATVKSSWQLRSDR